MNVKLSLAEGLNVAGMLLVKLTANGHEGYFALHTWPDLNIISEDFVKEIDANVLRQVTVTSEQGKIRRNIYGMSVSVGDVQIDNVISVGFDSKAFSEIFNSQHPELKGFLGLGFLRELKATVDFNKDELTLRFPDRCRNKPAYVMVNQGML